MIHLAAEDTRITDAPGLMMAKRMYCQLGTMAGITPFPMMGGHRSGVRLSLLQVYYPYLNEPTRKLGNPVIATSDDRANLYRDIVKVKMQLHVIDCYQGNPLFGLIFLNLEVALLSPLKTCAKHPIVSENCMLVVFVLLERSFFRIVLAILDVALALVIWGRLSAAFSSFPLGKHLGFILLDAGFVKRLIASSRGASMDLTVVAWRAISRVS